MLMVVLLKRDGVGSGDGDGDDNADGSDDAAGSDIIVDGGDDDSGGVSGVVVQKTHTYTHSYRYTHTYIHVYAHTHSHVHTLTHSHAYPCTCANIVSTTQDAYMYIFKYGFQST